MVIISRFDIICRFQKSFAHCVEIPYINYVGFNYFTKSMHVILPYANFPTYWPDDKSLLTIFVLEMNIL
jgi:hypothetical protein